ncbi:cellulose synthase [Neorhizobium sp. SOG26]|uniref:cellulose synthase n=1 Tax=Neorhizobium sp. SOG26 TaxID=2060726 RepID=UPI000E595611|nr:cellulose synthase [Neorhizobium sp. SOG26]AXV14407.1 cellulose synthase [Neorhizobium sp. SOG26]
MRFSLILLTALGIAAMGLYALKSSETVDLGLITSSISPGGPSDSAVEEPTAAEATTIEDGSAPELTAAEHEPKTPVEKTERMVSQLIYPNRQPQLSAAAKPDPAALVVAQSAPSLQKPPFDADEPATVAQVNPQTVITVPSTTRGNEEPVVDESALRYFAARGDTARLQAEISRLRTLYPNWTPPADPLAVRVNADRQLEEMWALYAQSRYADVRKAIADRQATEQGWQPPADLLDRLKLAEARASLVAASDAKNHEAVLRTAAENPSLLTCSEVDVLWRVAESFAQTDKKGRARDAYAYVLDNCDNASERFATLQKAAELLPIDMLDDLLSKERTPTGGQPEFEPLRDDIARRLVGQGNSDEKLVVPEKYLTRLERVAEANGLASDALLLGWYYYRRENLGAAERWFRRAFAKEETASAAEGLALTLIAQKSPVEAESVLYRWRDSSPGSKQAYLAAVANLLALDPPPVLQQEVLQRMAPVVIAERGVNAAQQFGWYARAMQQLETAAEWFSAALSWRADDEPSAYGLALTRNDLGDEAAVAQIQRNWAGRSERIARLGEPEEETEARRRAARANPADRQNQTPAANAEATPTPAQQVRRTQPVSRSETVVVETKPVQTTRRVNRVQVQTTTRRGQCSTTLDARQLSPDAALARGWCLMDLNRPMEAVQAFDAAYASTSADTRSDAAYGKSLAYLRVGLTDKAAVAAADVGQTNRRAVELQTAILADRALNAFKRARYRETLIALDQRAQIAPEQADLMALRGYAHLNLGRLADAKRIFQALADIGNKDGLRGLADIGAQY